MAERYNFKYLPLVGKLPGKSMVEQTETAINELASVVYDNVGHVGNLAEEVQTANANASNALDKATEALETSSRVYIKQIAAVDVNDYYDSELYYINNDGSTNIPVRDRGFLEVKTNDDKTACEQVFIADSTGTPYYRHGRITEQTLGEETTYVVTWSGWSSQPASQTYVQQELTNYLPLSGGTVTGGLTVEGTITGNLDGNAGTATIAYNDANGNPIAGTYLPLSGGTLTGDVDITGDLSVSGAIYSSDPASGENSGQVPTTAWVQKLLADALTQAKLDAHPVGSYYWSNDSTSPATLFGGTWEALPAGYTLIAQGSGTDAYGSFNYVAGTKYGERKHKLTTDELPHIHGTVSDIARQSVDQKLATSGVFSAPAYVEGVTFGTNFANNQGDGFVLDFGKDVPHENLPPCVAAYGWRRTA